MSNKHRSDGILKNAATINNLREKINQTVKLKEENPQAWSEACQIFHDSYDTLAFPGGLAEGLSLLQKKDPETISVAIEYLTADPYFFRSGYIKQKIMRFLKNVSLTQPQIVQLQNIVISAITSNKNKREHQEYWRIALKISDQKFQAQLKEIIETADNPDIREKAQYVLSETLK